MTEFEEAIITPENWFRQSLQMYEASKVLYESISNKNIVSESDTYRSVGSMKGAMLLLGIAAENALKGAHVQKEKPDLSKRKLPFKQFSDGTKNHDLIGIATKLGHPLSDEMRELFERLTIFVTWASKYQAAIKEDEHQEATGRLRLNYPGDYRLVENLIKELRANSGYDESSGWPIKC